MINPFGLEAIANPDLLPFERPFVAAHEWAHLAGYADESEASFVGFLTCIRAAAPAAYSGWLFLYWQINSEVGFRRIGGSSRLPSRKARVETSRRSPSACAADRCPCCATRAGASTTSTSKANRVEEGVRKLRSRSDAAGARAVRRGMDAGQTPGTRDRDSGFGSRDLESERP